MAKAGKKTGQMGLVLAMRPVAISFVIASTGWHRLTSISRSKCFSGSMPIIANRILAIVGTLLNDIRRLKLSVKQRCSCFLIEVPIAACRVVMVIEWWSVLVAGRTINSSSVLIRKLVSMMRSRLSNRRPLLMMSTEFAVIFYVLDDTQRRTSVLWY